MKKCAILIVSLVCIFTFNSCLSLGDVMGDGSDTVIKQSLNNNHTKKAILFLREAGATVADSYQVTIIGFKAEFDTTSVGNTFYRG